VETTIRIVPFSSGSPWGRSGHHFILSTQLHIPHWSRSTYIYRVPQCMSPRRNWDSSNPSPASECAHPPNQRVGSHSPAGGGLEESQFRRLEKKLSTLPTLWFWCTHKNILAMEAVAAFKKCKDCDKQKINLFSLQGKDLRQKVQKILRGIKAYRD
jgi:hypothetical protein